MIARVRSRRRKRRRFSPRRERFGLMCGNGFERTIPGWQVVEIRGAAYRVIIDPVLSSRPRTVSAVWGDYHRWARFRVPSVVAPWNPGPCRRSRVDCDRPSLSGKERKSGLPPSPRPERGVGSRPRCRGAGAGSGDGVSPAAGRAPGVPRARRCPRRCPWPGRGPRASPTGRTRRRRGPPRADRRPRRGTTGRATRRRAQ